VHLFGGSNRKPQQQQRLASFFRHVSVLSVPLLPLADSEVRASSAHLRAAPAGTQLLTSFTGTNVVQKCKY
jgi:hypothetical protein